jgi:hypothetical protein
LTRKGQKVGVVSSTSALPGKVAGEIDAAAPWKPGRLELELEAGTI